MSQSAGSGTRRDHYQSVERQTGQRPPEMDGPELPEELAHVWRWFQEVGPCMSGAMGPTPLTYQEIHAWMQVRQAHPTPDEVAAIRQLSEIYTIESHRAKGEG